MTSLNVERRPLAGNQGSGGVRTDQHNGDGVIRGQSTTGRSRVEVEVALLRIQLRQMAAGCGRPLRTAADERRHADRRRADELARMVRVGA